MDELRKLVEELLGQKLDDEVVSKASLDEETVKILTKQLETISQYKADFPTDVVKALGLLSQQAAFGVPVEKQGENDGDGEEVTMEQIVDQIMEKAGAKFSKDTQKILDTILSKFEAMNEAIAALRDLVPQKTEKGEDKDEDEDKEVTSTDLQKMFADEMKDLGISLPDAE